MPVPLTRTRRREQTNHVAPVARTVLSTSYAYGWSRESGLMNQDLKCSEVKDPPNGVHDHGTGFCAGSGTVYDRQSSQTRRYRTSTITFLGLIFVDVMLSDKNHSARKAPRGSWTVLPSSLLYSMPTSADQGKASHPHDYHPWAGLLGIAPFSRS